MKKKERRKLKEFGKQELSKLTDKERFDFAKYLLDDNKDLRRKDRKQIALTILKSR